MENTERNLRNRRGDQEGIAGEECEIRLNSHLPGGGFRGGLRQKCLNLDAFSCNLGISQSYFQA